MKRKLTDREQVTVGLLLPVAALLLLLQPRSRASQVAPVTDRLADILTCAAVAALTGL